MIYFFADNHYGVHPGLEIHRHLPPQLRAGIRFFEDDWNVLEAGTWRDDGELLILDLIGASCGLPHPGAGAERAVRAYCDAGNNVLLLHGGSAAFWQWPWWRRFCGMRWVRPNDPDGVAPSLHPVAPYHLSLTQSRHPLVGKLHAFALPADEIYIHLEQTNPIEVYLETTLASGIYPQLFECGTPGHGRVISFLPGHRPEVTANADVVATVRILIEELRKQDT